MLGTFGVWLAACGGDDTKESVATLPNQPGAANDAGCPDAGSPCSPDAAVVATSPDAGGSVTPPKQPMQPMPDPVCGDGLLQPNETCDDGNTVGVDGCARHCRVENGFVCPSPGAACVSSAVCGDAVLTLGEACDDANVDRDDGCSELCQIEVGWACLVPGLGCQPICGDARVVGSETCDDLNATSGDGCSPTCRLEGGLFDICGDAIVTNAEACDDGVLNGSGYGFCAADCTLGPRCGDGQITAGVETCDNGTNQDAYETSAAACAPGCVRASHCGDGQIDATFGEQCDDGVNAGAGAGCSPQCALGPR